MAQDITMIPVTQAGVPSGNYDGSSLDWYSDPVKAVNYYRGRGWIETVWFSVTDFQGVMTVEATVDQVPDTVVNDSLPRASAWFTVAEFGDYSSVITDHRPVTLAGNFTWLRIRIQDFQSGQINRVNLVY